MQMTFGAGLLAIVLGGTGLWLGESISDPGSIPGQDLRDEQEHLLAQYIYPRASPYAASGRSPSLEGLSKSFAKFTSEDSSEEVIAWYLGELGAVAGTATDGVFEIAGDFSNKLHNRSIAEVRAFVHDYRVLEKAGGSARGAVVWEATAEIRASGGATHILTVLVTRLAEESRTSIALTWFKV